MWSCLYVFICLDFLSFDVHSFPLSLPLVHSKYLYIFWENYFFISFKQIPFAISWLKPLNLTVESGFLQLSLHTKDFPWLCTSPNHLFLLSRQDHNILHNPEPYVTITRVCFEESEYAQGSSLLLVP